MQTFEVEANFLKTKNFLSHIEFGMYIEIGGDSESINLLSCPTTFIPIVPT